MDEVVIRDITFFSSYRQNAPKRNEAHSFDISLYYDHELQLLRQKFDPHLEEQIQTAYQKGSQLGIEMSEESIGVNYAKEFLSLISSHILIDGTRSLEIGCGNGYFLKLLKQFGSNPSGIEPGPRAISNVIDNEIKIIRGFFPMDLPPESYDFDLILAHAVLEHMVDPISMLIACKKALNAGGRLFIAVPDCGPYLKTGDPSILLHEHYSYFTEASLKRVMQSAGFNKVEVSRSQYGNLLYAVGVKSNSSTELNDSRGILNDEQYFIENVNSIRNGIIHLLKQETRQLGVYCPARAVSVLPAWHDLRLFDDDSEVYHHYFPMWERWIENRSDLLKNPVEVLWIMSISFGEKLKYELKKHLPDTPIYTLGELISFVASGRPETYFK